LNRGTAHSIHPTPRDTETSPRYLVRKQEKGIEDRDLEWLAKSATARAYGLA